MSLKVPTFMQRRESAHLLILVRPNFLIVPWAEAPFDNGGWRYGRSYIEDDVLPAVHGGLNRVRIGVLVPGFVEEDEYGRSARMSFQI